ncbi:MAG TPA: hypothetical protein VFE51_25955 [Verrucomicrobiae bacterium]|nr:hypothetical protein [Verrucomicrobiae bacterium]
MCSFKNRILSRALAILIVLVVVGCEKSQVAERKRAHPGEYAALSGEDKVSVDRGRLREGMTTNAVLMVWGKPTTISTISTPNGPFVLWEYYRKSMIIEDPQVMVPRSPTPVPRSRVLPGTPPSSRVVEWLDRTAAFHEERLVNWSPK